jgi:hypothetical protein
MSFNPANIRKKFTDCGAEAETIGSYEDMGGNKVYLFRLTVDANAAALLLENHGNPNNRNILKSNISKIIHDMDGGRWEDNADALVLDDDLMFKNGHHRLNALAQSSAKITFNCFVGVSSDLYDVGKARTVKDQLKMAGVEADITKKTPSIMVAWYLQQGRSDKRIRFNGSFSNAEIIAGTQPLHSIVIQLHDTVVGQENRHIARPQVIGALAWAAGKKSKLPLKSLAVSFLEEIRDMENLKKGSPVLWLSKKLGSTSTTLSSTQREILSLDVLYAFKAYCEGATDITKQPSQKARLEAYDHFAG